MWPTKSHVARTKCQNKQNILFIALLKLKADLSPEIMGIRPLCPTRWTVRAESLRSVLLNYSVIYSALKEIIEEYRGNSEATSQARGIMAIMEKFSFLFGIIVGEKLFTITDTLSKALQKKTMCAIEAKRLAAVTLSTLNRLYAIVSNSLHACARS